MALAVPSRYARALADLALDPVRGGDPQAVAAEVGAFESALSEFSDLRNVVLSPAVSPARKRAVVERLSGVLGASRLVRNFLYVIIDHRRTRLLPEIRQAFQQIVDERQGIVEALVSTARELNDQQSASVVARLEKLTGKRVRCRFTVASELIGGVTARIGSTIYDGSVRGQLDGLRRKLVGE